MTVVLSGTTASRGSVTGTAAVVDDVGDLASADALVDLGTAVDLVGRELEALAAAATDAGRAEEAEVLETYVTLAADPDLTEAVTRRQGSGEPLVAAVLGAADDVAQELASLESEYFAARAEDVRSVGVLLARAVAGREVRALALPHRAVVCARDLTPADTVRLDVERIAAFVTERGSPTSHTAIVARALGVAAAVGVTGLLDVAADGATVAVHATPEGAEVVVDPDQEALATAERRQDEARRRAVAHQRHRGATTLVGGRRVLVAANVGGPDDLDRAVQVEADGVGLLRSEFLFLGRDEPPDAREQEEVYVRAAESFEDPVVVRTLDIGGDKQIPYLQLAAEENPFLGVRGLRLWLAHDELLVPQVDALLRASASGPLQVMLPMVATLDDVRRCRARIDERAAALGLAPPPIGIMVETPAAALLAGRLAPEVDFLSIGTNDLTQYTTAADRTVHELAGYQDPLHPGVLRLVHHVVEAARPSGRPVAVCGEAAGDPVAALVLVGLGVDELSLAAAGVDEIRWLLQHADPEAIARTATDVLDAPDAAAVRDAFSPLVPR